MPMDEEMIEAARRWNARDHQVAGARLDTEISEGARFLHRHKRQLLAFARTMSKRILILMRPPPARHHTELLVQKG